MENGGNLAHSNVFVMFNVGGLDNPDQISDNWLDVSGNPCVKYTLKLPQSQGKISANRDFIFLAITKYCVLTKYLMQRFILVQFIS